MTTITSVLKETRYFPPNDVFSAQATISGMAAYQALCQRAQNDYEGFWAELARDLVTWKQPFTRVFNDDNAPFFKWFEDGVLNVSANCLDRHLAARGTQTALIFEADDGQVRHISYQDLYEQVCRFANGLKALGVRKGERVIIYLPMSVEAVVAMQACARIGAIHSVVFGGFSAKSVHKRIVDAGATLVITANEGLRGGKGILLKATVDEALSLGGCESVRQVVVYQRTPQPVAWQNGRDVWWHELVAVQLPQCEPEWMNAEDPLFINS